MFFDKPTVGSCGALLSPSSEAFSETEIAHDSAGPLQRFFGEDGHGGCGQVSLQALQARRRLVFVEVSGWVDVL